MKRKLMILTFALLVMAVAHARVPKLPGNATIVGQWINVTPAGVDLTDALDCGNYGTENVGADTANPGTLYTEFNCQGIWKSTDYGQTWHGPINTGTNGAAAGDCAGGITVDPSSTIGAAPTLYESCIRNGSVTGSETGFWRSTDGGVDWTYITISALPSGRQDVYPPVVDPYNRLHLLMCGHEQDYLIESTDGGTTWSDVSLASGMLENGGTGAVFFINTGSNTTTATTFLWLAQQAGGAYGTWRTTNDGSSWTQVDTNEHPHGWSQIYQVGTSGVVFMAGAYSGEGWGVLRSTDYGQTWAHVGDTDNQMAVWGTSNYIYSMYGFASLTATNPDFQLAAYPGTGTWNSPGLPTALNVGIAGEATVNNGANVFVGAMWVNGLWRYVEP